MLSKVGPFKIFHLIWMGVIFTTNDYQSLEFDVSSERNINEEFFISVAFYEFGFIQAPLQDLKTRRPEK